MKERPALTVIAVGFALLVFVISATGVGERFELPLRDRLMRIGDGEPASSVAVVAIDDASLAAIGAWPWSRAQLARVIDAAFVDGAVAVGVDVLLVEPSPEDVVLADSLRRGDSMLLAGVGTGTEALLPPPPLSGSAELVHGVLELDGDGVLRRLSATKQTESSSYTALAVAAAARIRRDLAIPVGRGLVPAFSVRPDDIPLVHASELLSGISEGVLKGRVVFVGVAATGLGDRVITPVTRKGHLDPGVVVHAAVAEALIRDDLVTIVPPWAAALVAFVFFLAAWGAGRLGGGAHIAGVILVILIPLLVGSAASLEFDVAFPIALLTLTNVAAVLLIEARALRAVERGVGRATRALGAETAVHGSPSERVRQLEAVAAEIARERLHAGESHRTVAHELRTPLTSIRGLAQLLAAYDLSDDERRRVAAMVAEESTRLHDMVEGLLDLERLALRDRTAGARVFDLGSILAKRAELARAVGRQTVVLECAEPLRVEGDPSLLERMIENLMGNAMKFSPPESRVSMRGVRRGDEVIVEVEDEGPGIPPEERESVFRRFGRGATEQAGLGLGLAFVAEIARWHGGSVEVDEGVHGGACLRVRLPASTEEASKESTG